MKDHSYYMELALEEARRAYAKGEVPIGAVLVIDDRVVAKAHNTREENQQALNHAEMLVIKEGCEKQGFWRLDNSYLYTTVEPCVMCSGAIGLARIPNVVYGAKNQKFGAAGSLYDILTDERLNHRVDVETGILESECAGIMQDFFRNRRKK